MKLTPGMRLGSYEILELLGAGGMGEVWAARDIRLGRRIALKVLPTGHPSGQRGFDRFTREARAASSLNHPNIITIHEVAFDSTPPYIAMEYVDGVSLREHAGGMPVAARALLTIAAQIADGLAVAHENGVVHRDLKPENVMMTNEGLVKILDFGLAKPAASGEGTGAFEMDVTATHPGTIIGTAAYMSPEQARGQEVDYRSDQFSFGLILYELATGIRAFRRGSAAETLAAIISEEHEPAERVNPKVPQPLSWIIDRCLAKDPSQRYASTRDLERELATLRDHLTHSTVSGQWPERFERRRVGAILAASIAAIIVIGGGIAIVARHSDGAMSFTGGSVAASTLPSQKFLAVLPFEEIGGSEGESGDLIARGLSATVGARLARIEGLQVMTASKFDRASDLATVGRELGANLVLTASVQRVGDRIRVTYAIVEPSRGVQLAAETVDAFAGDLFLFQDEIAERVARSLDLRDRGAPKTGPAFPDLAAQDRYLQALGSMQRYDDEVSVDGAIRLLEEISENGTAAIYAALGKAYLLKYDLTRQTSWASKAVSACERATALDRDLPEVHATLGEVQLKMGRAGAAIESFRKAIEASPTMTDAVLGLADAYRDAGEKEKAEAMYRRAIDLQPGYWGVYNRAGAFYHRTGRYAKSAEMFRKVVQMTPDSARGHYNLGGALFSAGEYEAATSAFRRSIEISPTSSAWANLATAQYFEGRFDEAAAAYQRAVALSPDNYMLWAYLGDAWRLSEGEKRRAPEAYEKAIDLGRRVLAVNPADPVVHSRLAVCHAKLGRHRDAAQHMRKALDGDAQGLSILIDAATVEVLAGRRDQARALVDQALAGGWDEDLIRRDPELRSLSYTRTTEARPAEGRSRS